MKTQSQNMKDMVARGRNGHLSGEHNPLSKFTDAEIEYIQTALKEKRATIRQLADQFKVAFQTIYRIGRGKRKGTKAVIEKRDFKRLTPELVAQILRLASDGVKQSVIAEMFDTHQGDISSIVRGKIWKNVPRPDGIPVRKREKLTAEMVLAIKSDLISGTKTQLQISLDHGISDSAVSAIRFGITWKHVGPEIPKEIPQPHRKLSDQDHIDILNEWNSGSTEAELAEKFGVRIDSIADIKSKTSKKHGIPCVNRRNKTKASNDTLLKLLERYNSGEKIIDLATEIGMSKSGLAYALIRIQEAA